MKLLPTHEQKSPSLQKAIFGAICVYLLLANLLPLDAALELANSKDHTLSDKFVQLLQLRFPQLTEDGTFKQLQQQHQQKVQCLDLVAKFLELVDAKIKREKELHLTIEAIAGSLSNYAPFPLIVTIDTPTDKDVVRIVENYAQRAG